MVLLTVKLIVLCQVFKTDRFISKLYIFTLTNHASPLKFSTYLKISFYTGNIKYRHYFRTVLSDFEETILQLKLMNKTG